MTVKEYIVVIVSLLLALTLAQNDEDTCKASVFVLSKEELAREIQTQVAVVISRGGIYPAALPKHETALTSENVSLIVEELMNKQFKKIEELIKDELAKLHIDWPGAIANHPASSCKEILEFNESSPSGFYWLRSLSNTSVKMHCDMTRSCGGVTGGWMKVAKLDMTNDNHQCPRPLTFMTRNNKCLCASNLGEGVGCASVNYMTHGIEHSEVCGKVIGYQKGSPDGPSNGGSINGPYIDGVSLTHSYPRKHIWTFIATLHESPGNTNFKCYCSNRNNRGISPPSFVGQDYFCETGNSLWNGRDHSVFFDRPLWDGTGCGPDSECCTFHNPPWFYKRLAKGTGDNLEMRICRDQPASDEDILLEKVDIYVR